MKDLIQKKEESSCVHYMRALAINKSIDAVVKTFIMYEEDLLQGKMAKSLIETSKLADSLKKLYDDAKENVYQSWEVIQVEAMGYKVLGELIDFFMEWVNNPTSGQSKKVAILLQAAKVFKDNEGREAREARLTHMLDYISGMTDSFALETYRKLTGIL